MQIEMPSGKIIIIIITCKDFTGSFGSLGNLQDHKSFDSFVARKIKGIFNW